jgi:hypothetical protein
LDAPAISTAAPAPPDPRAALLHLPLKILLTGLAGVAVLFAAEAAGLPSPAALLAGIGAAPAGLAAVLVFLLGVAFAAFLWWLAARSFALLRDPRTTPEQLASLRDLPLALPEGTVRAILALIVGVVGLPLLLFSQVLHLPDAVAGYVNGIIAGVFGYYFGARGGAPDAQAARRAAEALRADNASLAGQLGSAAEAAARPGQMASTLDRLGRQIGIAETLVETLGPALPAGLLPANAADLLGQARIAVAAAAAAPADAGTLGQVTAAAAALAGGSGPFASLLSAASTALPAIAGGPLAPAALLLGLGWQASSAGWRRWRAQVLAAPHDPTLFDPGSITPSSALLRLAEAPIFAAAFHEVAEQPGFAAGLLDIVLRPDAADRLWAAHGARFASPEQAAQGLAEYRHAILSERAAADITAPVVEALASRLSAAPATLRPAAPDATTARALLAAAGNPAAPPAGRAAIEALALLAGTLRDRRIDPVQAMTELVA